MKYQLNLFICWGFGFNLNQKMIIVKGEIWQASLFS